MRESPSEAYTAAIAAERAPELKITINGTVYTGDAIAGGSFIQKSGITSAGKFEVGGCVIGSCNFTLLDYGHRLQISDFNAGDAVNVYIGYDGEFLQTGAYIITEVTPRDNNFYIQCLDRLSVMDKQIITLSYPCTVLQVVQKCCTLSGLSLESSSFTGSDVSITRGPDRDITARQALQYVLQMTGNYALVTGAGRLRVSWFDTSKTPLEIRNTFTKSCTTGGEYTGVRVAKNGQADIDTDLIGEEGCVYIVKSNPFITSGNVQRVKTLVWGALSGLWFASGSAGIVSNPLIEPGDIINLDVYRGNFRLLPVTSLVYKAGVQMSITCDAAENAIITDNRQGTSDNTTDSEAMARADEAYTAATKNPVVVVKESDFNPSTWYSPGTIILVVEDAVS